MDNLSSFALGYCLFVQVKKIPVTVWHLLYLVVDNISFVASIHQHFNDCTLLKIYKICNCSIRARIRPHKTIDNTCTRNDIEMT